MAKPILGEDVTSKMGGPLADQFKRFEEAKRLREPALNANGTRAKDLGSKIDLGIDPELIRKLTGHILVNLSKMSVVPDMETVGKLKTLPDSLVFGYSTFNPVTYFTSEPGGRDTYVDDLLAYYAGVYDTNVQLYDHREMFFKTEALPVNGQLIPNISYTRLKLAMVAPTPDNIVRLWDFIEAFPIVGWNIGRNIKRLIEATKLVISEDEARIRRDTLAGNGRMIDTRHLLTRLQPELTNANLNGLAMALNLTPPATDLASYSRLEAELFNRLLDKGQSDGLFSDFDSLIEYLNKPLLLPKCPIGRFKDKPWTNVPRSMVAYYLKQTWIFDPENKDLRYTLNNIDAAMALNAQEKI